MLERHDVLLLKQNLLLHLLLLKQKLLLSQVLRRWLLLLLEVWLWVTIALEHHQIGWHHHLLLLELVLHLALRVDLVSDRHAR